MAAVNNKGRKKKNIDTFFADKLLDLLANEKKNGITQEDVAKSIGVSRQALGKWANGSTVPDIIDLKKIAQYFNVSADYLIGLSDTASLDTDLQAVCKYTRLSEKSIRKIKEEFDFDDEISMESESERIIDLAEVLNCIFCSNHFWDIIWDLLEIWKESDKYINSPGYKTQTSMNIIAEKFEISPFRMPLLMNLDRSELNKIYNHLDHMTRQGDKCDLLRYKISKYMEKISDCFDRRTENYEYDTEASIKYLNITEEQLEKIKKEGRNNAQHPPKEE